MIPFSHLVLLHSHWTSVFGVMSNRTLYAVQLAGLLARRARGAADADAKWLPKLERDVTVLLRQSQRKYNDGTHANAFGVWT